MSRSRPKLDTSPIEYDDVVDSPALKGMVSFLEIAPGQLPRLDFTTAPDPTESGTPRSGPPLTGLPDSGGPLPGIPGGGARAGGSPVRDAPVTGSPAPDTPDVGIPFSATPASGIPEPAHFAPSVAYPPVLSRPLTRIRRATVAQDGHSFGEQALYDALWQHAHPYGPETRIVTLGYRRMADLARLTVNNCKANIQSLIQKLAVEEVASFTHSQGRTYLIYSGSATLQRRRENGLTHYIKSRGVVFVDPDTGEPLTERIRDRSGAPFSTVPQQSVPADPPRSGIPHSVAVPTTEGN
jgi:hypothetical protein